MRKCHAWMLFYKWFFVKSRWPFQCNNTFRSGSGLSADWKRGQLWEKYKHTANQVSLIDSPRWPRHNEGHLIDQLKPRRHYLSVVLPKLIATSLWVCATCASCDLSQLVSGLQISSSVEWYNPSWKRPPLKKKFIFTASIKVIFTIKVTNGTVRLWLISWKIITWDWPWWFISRLVLILSWS